MPAHYAKKRTQLIGVLFLSWIALAAVLNLWLSNWLYSSALSYVVTINLGLLVSARIWASSRSAESHAYAPSAEEHIQQDNRPQNREYNQFDSQPSEGDSQDSSSFALATDPIKETESDSTQPIISPDRLSDKEKHLQRFVTIGHALKRSGYDVLSKSPSDIATLANLLSDHCADKDMIAVWMPDHVVRFNLKRTIEFEHHAQMLREIVLATGQPLIVRDIHSKKDPKNGDCVVSFTEGSHSVNWRFTEPTEQLSTKFLEVALTWVGKKAQGRFIPLEHSGDYISYVFVLESVIDQLQEAETHG